MEQNEINTIQNQENKYQNNIFLDYSHPFSNKIRIINQKINNINKYKENSLIDKKNGPK